MSTVALPQQIDVADHRRTRWRVDVAAQHSLEDARHPRYLWSKKQFIAPGHIIEYWPANKSYYIETIVVEIDDKTQSVVQHELQFRDFRNVDAIRADISHIIPDWGGPAHKWRVRVGDEILAKGFATQDLAQAWIDEQSGETPPKESEPNPQETKPPETEAA